MDAQIDSLAVKIGDLKVSPPFTISQDLKDGDFGTLLCIHRIEKGCTESKLEFNLPFPTKELTIVFGKEEGPQHHFDFVHSGDSTHLDFTFKQALPRPYIIRIFAKEYYIE
jgi:hypothetical protein